MRRFVVYSVVLAILGGASIAVADWAVVTDEEVLSSLLVEVTRSRGVASAGLSHVDLNRVPLEVSVGESHDRFGPGDDAALAQLASDVDAEWSESNFEVRQSDIQIEGGTARVIANLIVAGRIEGSVAIRADLRKVGARWWVERLRVMD